MWSAIYYVDTGEDPGADNGGATRFMDMSGIPRPIGEGKDYGLEVEPEPGKMVIFPSTLPHYVTPYLGRNQLITIVAKLSHRDFIVADPRNPRARTDRMRRNWRAPMTVLDKIRTVLGGKRQPDKP